MNNQQTRERSLLLRISKIILSFLLCFATIGISLVIKPQTAEARIATETVSSNFMFQRNGINANTENAKIETVAVNFPGADIVQEINGYVDLDTDGVAKALHKEQGYTVRLPVERIDAWHGTTEELLSNAKGEAMLNGGSITITWKNVGTYTNTTGDTKKVKLKMTVDNFVDAKALNRLNNLGQWFNYRISHYWGEGAETLFKPYQDMGHGYLFSFLPNMALKEASFSKECHLFGVQSADIQLEFLYEDGSSVMLPDGTGMLTTAGQIDADHLGVEGVKILEGKTGDSAYLSSNTTLRQGSITATSGFQDNAHGWSPSLYKQEYLNEPSENKPVFYGTYPDNHPTMPESALKNYDPYGSAESLVSYGAEANVRYSNYLNSGVSFTSAVAGEGPAKAKFTAIDQVGHIGYPISFTTLTAYQPLNPEKTVDKTEASLGEEVTYTITQKINERGVDCINDYTYDSMTFTDQLDAALTYKSLKVFDDQGNNVTTKAGQLAQSGQTITYSFNADYLESTMQYDGETYTFVLIGTVTNPSAGLDIVANKANTLFNNKYSMNTDSVKTMVNTASVGLEKKVDYEWRVNDEVEYSLVVTNPIDGSIANNVSILDDSLPSDIEIYDAKITGVPATVHYPIIKNNEETIEKRTNEYSVSASGNKITGSIKYLPAHTPATITFKIKALEKYNGMELVNTAQASLKNPHIGATNPVFASDIIWINSPWPQPIKTSDKVAHSVGDTVKYTIDVTNENNGTVGRNLTIRDEFQTTGIEIDRNSIVIYDTAGNVITESTVIEQNKSVQGFTVKTNRSIVNEGTYSKYTAKTGVEEQDAQNPLGYELETLITIEFTAKITQESAAGIEIMNHVSTSVDETFGGEDDEVLTPNGPVLNIKKTPSTQQAIVDDIVTYTLEVTQTREAVTAKSVIIDDFLDQAEGELVADSIRVFDKKWTEFTQECGVLTEKEKRIETNRDLDDNDKFFVTYEVCVKGIPQQDSITNTARAWASNAELVLDKALVTVDEKEPAEIVASKVSNPPSNTPVSAGEEIAYSIVIENIGGKSARNIAVHDVMPVNTTFVRADEIHGASFTEETNSIGWNIELAEPGTKIYLPFTVRVNENVDGNTIIKNMATFAPDTPGTPAEPLPNPTNLVEHPVKPGELDIQKSSDPATGSSVEGGQEITYTITAINRGGSTLNEVAIHDAIPDYTTFVSVESIHDATYHEKNNSIGWSIPEIVAKEEIELVFVVRVDADIEVGTQIENFATFALDTPGVPKEPLKNKTNIVEHFTPSPAHALADGKGHDKTGNPFAEYTWIVLVLALGAAAGLCAYGIRKRREVNKLNILKKSGTNSILW